MDISPEKKKLWVCEYIHDSLRQLDLKLFCFEAWYNGIENERLRATIKKIRDAEKELKEAAAIAETI